MPIIPTTRPCASSGECKTLGQSCCQGLLPIRNEDCVNQTQCVALTPTPTLPSGCNYIDDNGVTGSYSKGSNIGYFKLNADRSGCVYGGMFGPCGSSTYPLGTFKDKFTRGQYASMTSCEISLASVSCLLTDSTGAFRRYAAGNTTFYFSRNTAGICASNKYGDCGDDVPNGSSNLIAGQFVSQISCQTGSVLSPTPTVTVKPRAATPTPTPTPVIVNCRDTGGGKGFCANSCGTGYQQVPGVLTECNANTGPGTGTQVCCQPATGGGCAWCEKPATAANACSGNGGTRDPGNDSYCAGADGKVCFSCGGGGSACPFKQAWKCYDASGAFSHNTTASCGSTGDPCGAGKHGDKEGNCYKDCDDGSGTKPAVLTCGSITGKANPVSLALGQLVTLDITHHPDQTYAGKLLKQIYGENDRVLFKIIDGASVGWIVGKKEADLSKQETPVVLISDNTLALSYNYLPKSVGLHKLVISGRTGEYDPKNPGTELYCDSAEVAVKVTANLNDWQVAYWSGQSGTQADFNADSKVDLADYLSWWLSEGGSGQ